MTKSIQKAQANDIAIKGKVGDNDIYFINPAKLIVEDIELGDIIKGLKELNNKLIVEIKKQAEINTSLLNEIQSIAKQNEVLKGQLNDLKRLFQDTIESWVKLWEK